MKAVPENGRRCPVSSVRAAPLLYAKAGLGPPFRRSVFLPAASVWPPDAWSAEGLEKRDKKPPEGKHTFPAADGSLLQNTAEKLPCTGLAGVDEDLLRRAVLGNHARIHEDDAVADVAGEGHLVRDHQHGPLPRRAPGPAFRRAAAASRHWTGYHHQSQDYTGG